MVNEVEIDAPALASEAAAVELPPEAEAPAPGQGEGEGEAAALEARSLEQAQREYEPVVGMVLGTVAATQFPAWRITDDERKQLTAAASAALAHWWPDGNIPPKYLSLVMVVYVGYTIVEARRDPATGELAPRRIDTAPRSAAPGRAAAPAAVVAAAGDGFSTSA